VRVGVHAKLFFARMVAFSFALLFGLNGGAARVKTWVEFAFASGVPPESERRRVRHRALPGPMDGRARVCSPVPVPSAKAGLQNLAGMATCLSQQPAWPIPPPSAGGRAISGASGSRLAGMPEPGLQGRHQIPHRLTPSRAPTATQGPKTQSPGNRKPFCFALTGSGARPSPHLHRNRKGCR